MDKNQIQEIAAFLTTSAVAWFSAGVIAPLFTIPYDNRVIILSMACGLSMAIIFMIFSVIIIKGKTK